MQRRVGQHDVIRRRVRLVLLFVIVQAVAFGPPSALFGPPAFAASEPAGASAGRAQQAPQPSPQPVRPVGAPAGAPQGPAAGGQPDPVITIAAPGANPAQGTRLASAQTGQKPARPSTGLKEVSAQIAFNAPLSAAAGGSLRPAAPQAITEGFENIFPRSGSCWQAYDRDGANNGQYFWDDTPVRVRTGSWSAWPADGGANAVSPTAGYPNYVNSWMTCAIYLEGVSSARVTFWVWNDSELEYDYFWYAAGVNQTNYFGYGITGNTNGWVQRTLDLAQLPTIGSVVGRAVVFVAFGFTSDFSTGGPGAFLDDISISTGAPNTRPADFNGDGKTDLSVFRPSTATWWIKDQSPVQFGQNGDIPVVGDYNGDGLSEIAVFRPSDRTWRVNGGQTVSWGLAGDIPVPGDYNGDGLLDFAVYRPSNRTWWPRSVPGGQQWGNPGDIPVPGDYNGDGKTDYAVFRPSTGTWWVYPNISRQWGAIGDIPVPGDYNGDGKTEFAVYRPSNRTWWVYPNVGVQWGVAGDIPVPGDYNGDGKTEFAVFRPSNGTWWPYGGSAGGWGVNGDIPLPKRPTYPGFPF